MRRSSLRRARLSVAVEDVDGLLERVEAAGGRVLGPPTDMPWGRRVAHIHDPGGNTVNLTQESAR
ncbi:VOC family protein [Nonomuraea sp. NPDC050540]|uniref:VOC family protein n=1 Tax=Nonomuraea sp. NPDC050540 TaxID=3364367 RepID=UPI0037ACCEB5